MPRIKYVGKEKHELAGIGPINPNDVFIANVSQAAALEHNDPENYQVVPDDTPLVQHGRPTLESKKGDKKAVAQDKA
ncbi:MAG: hypothetical protein SFV32_12735 [Opitutaceae bacterium]|nr:hypothetical protein [Opitutaceae bacterium]